MSLRKLLLYLSCLVLGVGLSAYALNRASGATPQPNRIGSIVHLEGAATIVRQTEAARQILTADLHTPLLRGDLVSTGAESTSTVELYDTPFLVYLDQETTLEVLRTDTEQSVISLKKGAAAAFSKGGKTSQLNILTPLARLSVEKGAQWLYSAIIDEKNSRRFATHLEGCPAGECKMPLLLALNMGPLREDRDPHLALFNLSRQHEVTEARRASVEKEGGVLREGMNKIEKDLSEKIQLLAQKETSLKEFTETKTKEWQNLRTESEQEYEKSRASLNKMDGLYREANRALEKYSTATDEWEGFQKKEPKNLVAAHTALIQKLADDLRDADRNGEEIAARLEILQKKADRDRFYKQHLSDLKRKKELNTFAINRQREGVNQLSKEASILAEMIQEQTLEVGTLGEKQELLEKERYILGDTPEEKREIGIDKQLSIIDPKLAELADALSQAKYRQIQTEEKYRKLLDRLSVEKQVLSTLASISTEREQEIVTAEKELKEAEANWNAYLSGLKKVEKELEMTKKGREILARALKEAQENLADMQTSAKSMNRKIETAQWNRQEKKTSLEKILLQLRKNLPELRDANGEEYEEYLKTAKILLQQKRKMAESQRDEKMNQSRMIEKNLTEQMETAKKEMKDLQNKINGLKSEIEKAKEEFRDWEIAAHGLKAKISETQQAIEQERKRGLEAASLNTQYDSLTDALEQLYPKLSTARQQAITVSKELEGLRTSVKGLNISEPKEVREAKTRQQQLGKEVEKLAEKLSILSRERERLSEEKGKERAAVENLKRRLAESRELESKFAAELRETEGRFNRMSEKEGGARESREKIAEHLKRLHTHRAALKEKMRSSEENRELYTQAFQETEHNIEIQERRLKSYISQLRDTASEIEKTRGPVESLKHSLTEHKLRSTATEIDLNKASAALMTVEKGLSANQQIAAELLSSETKLAQEIIRATELIERHKKETAASEKQRRAFSARITTLEEEQRKLATLVRQMEGERSRLETKLAQVKSALDQNGTSPSSIFVSLNAQKESRKISLSPFQMAVISNDGESRIITLSDQKMNWVWNLRKELEKLAQY